MTRLRRLLLALAAAALPSCLPAPQKTSVPPAKAPLRAADCLGTTALPPEFQAQFAPAEDAALLKASLGEPGEGKLCQAAVYRAKEQASVSLYRAWNSTNPGSRLGRWWSFSLPEGSITQYREDFEICYQWSPLDRLVECKLKPGTRVAVGTGQSAECSQYLSYPVSASQQIYIEDSATLTGCEDQQAVFAWQATPGE